MLVATISGGAAIAPATGALATRTSSFHTAIAIPTAFYVLAWVFPAYVNVWNKQVLDGHRATDLNVDAARTVHVESQDEKAMSERVSGVREERVDWGVLGLQVIYAVSRCTMILSTSIPLFGDIISFKSHFRLLCLDLEYHRFQSKHTTS